MSRPWQLALVWLAAAAALVAFVRVFGAVLLPFLLAAAIAYLLNPVVRKMARWGVPGWAASALALGGFAVLAAGAVIVLAPAVAAEAGRLGEALPDYVARAVSWLRHHAGPVLAWIGTASEAGGGLDLRDWAGRGVETLFGWAGGIAATLGNLVNLLALLVVTPVVAFYLLRDWPKIMATMESLVPRQNLGAVRKIAGEIDETLAGFVRGVGTVCLALAVLYATGLAALGLEFGIVIGLAAGFLSFIPYVGTIVGFVTATALAAVQFGASPLVLAVAGVFVAGQIVEGYVLTPKLVGDRVGLHPVWILFALLAGGAVAGFAGLLIAVPAAAAIGVILRHWLAAYRASALYAGGDNGGGTGA